MARVVDSRTARTSRWEWTAATEVFLNLIQFSMWFIGYHQLIAPACHSQPHSLPADSRALARYPCDGSTASTFLYTIFNAHSIVWDYCHLHVMDRWMLLCAAPLLLRLAGSMFLPPQLYDKFVAPAAVYTFRGVIPAFHLLKGPGFRPSPLAVRALFRNFAAFDIAYFCSVLGVWPVNSLLELVFCCYMAVSLWVLCYWYRDIVPGGVNLPLQIATRVLVPVVTLSLAWAAQRGQHDMGGGLVGTSGSSSRAGAGAMTVQPDRKPKDLGTDEEDQGDTSARGYKVTPPPPSCGGYGGGDHGAGSSAVDADPMQRLGPDLASASRHRASPMPHVDALQPGITTTPSHNTVSGGANTGSVVPSGVAVEPSPPASPSACASSATATSTPNSSSAAGDVPRTDAAAPPWEQPPQPPQLQAYQPYVRYRTTYAKIPWAEPEQLPPDFRERLKEVVERQGVQPRSRRPAGAYVRRGCIELALVVESWRAADPPAGPDAPSPDFPLKASQLVRALGLPPRLSPPAMELPTQEEGDEGGAGPSAAAANGAGTGAIQEVVGGAAASRASASPQGLGSVRTWVVEDKDDDGGGGREPTAAPRVLNAWPRVVVVLPSSVPDTALSAGATRFPATLRVVVVWGKDSVARDGNGGPGPSTSFAASSGGQEGVGSPEETEAGRSAPSRAGPQEATAPQEGPRVQVLVRACNEYLPARVTSAGGIPATSGDVSYKYDVELLQRPPRPGVLLVELFRGSDVADGGGGRTGFTAPHRRQSVEIAVLATYDPDVASELTGAVADWPPDARWQLDGLLYDMGTWMAAEAGGEGRHNDPFHRQLHAYLLQYMESAGLVRTGALLGVGGASRQRDTPGTSLRESPAATAASALGDSKGGNWQGSAAGAASISVGGDGSQAAVGVSRSGALGPVMTPMENWSVGMAGTLQLLDSVLLLALLLRENRAGLPLFSAANVPVLMCMGISAVSLLARLLLPYTTWARFAVRARVPRYVLYIASKALVGAGVAPPASGAAQYTTGAGLLVHEGLILPGCCLLDLRTAALFATLKTPATAGVILRAGAVASPAAALFFAARTEVLALATTAACHAYLKRRHRARGVEAREREATVALSSSRSGGGGASSDKVGK